jgi:hypothetical protein
MVEAVPMGVVGDPGHHSMDREGCYREAATLFGRSNDPLNRGVVVDGVHENSQEVAPSYVRHGVQRSLLNS